MHGPFEFDERGSHGKFEFEFERAHIVETFNTILFIQIRRSD